jgi:RNA polymerase sigma factor (sigma-70 family)
MAELRAAVHAQVTQGRFWAGVELLLASPLLDAIPRKLASQFGDLDLAAAEDVLADALDVLIVRWQEGGRPDRPDAYLWRTCWNKAQDEVERRGRFDEFSDDGHARPDEDDRVAGPEPSREVLRREALRVARQALPRIAQERPREAMDLILDAVEAQVELSNAELGERMGVTAANARKLRERGFKRLEEALTQMGARLSLRWAFELEEREYDDDDEESDT